jgi:hypothetical protein
MTRVAGELTESEGRRGEGDEGEAWRARMEASDCYLVMGQRALPTP